MPFNRRVRDSFFVFSLTLWVVPAFGQADASAGRGAVPLTAEQWRADVLELVDHLRSNHRDVHHSVSPEALDSAIEDLLKRLPALSPVEIVGELAKLLASIGDGHTRLSVPVSVANLGFQQGHTADPDPAPGAPRFHTLPLRFADFAGGVHVASATAEHANAIGARLLTIGGDPVEAVIERLGPFVAHDVPAGLRFHAIKLLAVPELVALAGSEAAPGSTVLTVQRPGQEEETLTLAGLAYEETKEWVEPEGWVSRSTDDPYFAIETERAGSLIVRVYQINDSPSETIGAFARRMTLAIEGHDPERVVLDLRYCHGGDQSLSRALVLPLIRWPGSRIPGRLFALVGPETFSAAVNLSSRLEEWTQVTFVGEGLGSGPSHYSSSDREVLDNSGLVARVSTGYFVGWTGSEWRQSVEIGLPVQPAIEDYLAGVDTVLEAALAYRPAEGLANQIIQAYGDAGINAALILWSRYRTDPATAHLDHEAAGNAFARFLLDAGALRYAANIFLFNREFHPRSIDAFLGEAEARHGLGDAEAALDVLEQARAIAPEDPRIESLTRRVRFVPVDCDPNLGDDARCGTLTVPERRDDPERRIEIHVAVLPSRSESAAEPLLLFPGGPGQATTDLAALVESLYPEVRSLRDVVLVGQRGTGISHPLSCPHDVASFPTLVFGQLWDVDKIRSCADEEGRRSDLSSYATADYLADIADALDTLGYGSAMLWGGSGGSRTAAAFIRAYPERVVGAVLDGVVPIDYAMPLPFAQSLEKAWDRVVEDCGAQPECASAFSDLEGDLDRIIDALERRPSSVSIEGGNGERITVPFHRSDFAYALRGVLYSARRIPGLPAEVHHAARTGDYRYFAQALHDRSAAILGRALSLGLHLSVYCREDVPRFRDADVSAATRDTVLGDYLVRQYRSACDAWPVEPAPAAWYRPFTSDVPVLMVSGRYDPSTPEGSAERARRSFPNSIHLVVGNASHGAGFRCARPVVEDFLSTANLPADADVCRADRVRFRSTRSNG